MSSATIFKIEAHDDSYEIEDPGGLIGKSLRAGNPYEAKVLEHAYRLVWDQGEIEPGAMVLDAGAGVGNHSLWFAAICGLRVRAFEPLVYEQLRRNVELNDLADRIEVYPYALGARDDVAESLGRGELRIGEGHVPVKAYDEATAPWPIALMKIDVEGMETAVLAGAAETLRVWRPRIFAEARTPADERELAAFLAPYGYERQRTYGATPLIDWKAI